MRQYAKSVDSQAELARFTGHLDVAELKSLLSAQQTDLSYLEASKNEMDQLAGLDVSGVSLAELASDFPHAKDWIDAFYGLEEDQRESNGATAISDYYDELASCINEVNVSVQKTLMRAQVTKLYRDSQRLPMAPDVMAHYQSSLDSELYTAVRALREAQAHRLETSRWSRPPLVTSAQADAGD